MRKKEKLYRAENKTTAHNPYLYKASHFRHIRNTKVIGVLKINDTNCGKLNIK